MTRAELVERARDAISGWSVDDIPIDGTLAEEMAASVVDALLPQAIALEEVQALPQWAIFEDRLGWAWVVAAPGAYRSVRNGTIRNAHEIRVRGPLTVVRMP